MYAREFVVFTHVPERLATEATFDPGQCKHSLNLDRPLGRTSSHSLLEQVKRNSDTVERWKNVDLLMIDEISMLSKKVFNSIEFIARTLRENMHHFGGIQVIGSGDFYQLPPVPNPMNNDTGNFAFTNRVWNKVFPHTFIIERT